MSFLDCCRCCLENKGSQNQFALTTSYDKGTIQELIEGITNLKILLTPSLPSTICNICLAKLLGAEEIKSKCIESEDILRSMIEPSVTIKEEASEIDFESVQVFPDEPCDTEIKSENSSTEVSLKEEQEEFIPRKVKKKRNHSPSEEEEPIRTPKKSSKKKKSRETQLENENFKCDTCESTFKSKVQFQLHLRKHRKDNDPPIHTCETCEKTFYSNSWFAKHSCYFKPICHYCGQKFALKSMVISHLDETHRSADHRLYCNAVDCKYSCTTARGFFFHLAAHYNPLNLVCEICSEVFTNLSKFNTHNSHKHRNKKKRVQVDCVCDLCGAMTSSKTNMQRHIQSKHLNEKFFCDLCAASFSCAESVMHHKVKKHGQETPHKCLTCQKCFTFHSSLKYHEERKHGIVIERAQRRRRPGDKKPLRKTVFGRAICEFCCKEFSAINLKRHIQVVHLKEKRFPCPHEGCNSIFGQKVQMQVHYRQHSGEKPHACSECEFRCADPSTMVKHLKNVHKIEKKRNLE